MFEHANGDRHTFRGNLRGIHKALAFVDASESTLLRHVYRQNCPVPRHDGASPGAMKTRLY